MATDCVRVELCGIFDVKFPSATVALPSTVQRLIALLCVRGPLSRSAASSILWPRSTEDRAQGSLRTALWQLNKLPQRMVVSNDDHLSIAPEVDVDLTHFLRVARQVLRGGEDLVDVLTVLPGGDLLSGWNDEWIALEREHYRQLRSHALEIVARRLSDAEEFGAAVDAAMECVEAEPLRESAHKILIELHLRQGNMSDAMRHYELIRRMLREQLNVEPSPDLTQLLLSTSAPAARRPGVTATASSPVGTSG